MGKHSSGQQNYSIAKGPLIALIAIVLLIVAATTWVNLKSDNTADHEASNSTCSRGDLTLIVATDPAQSGQVQKLVEEYGNSNPVVKDYCVRPQMSVVGSEEMVNSLGKDNTHGVDVTPGVWVPADQGFVDRAKQQDRVAVEDPVAWLNPTKAGIAVTPQRAQGLEKSTWQQLAEQKIATPGGSDAALSAVVNDALGGGANAATSRARLGENFTANSLLPQLSDKNAAFDGVAATQPMLDLAGTDLRLVVPDGAPELNSPIVPFGSGGPINENTARASADFVKFAKNSNRTNTDDHGSSMSQSALDLLPLLSGMKTDPQALPPSQAAAEAGTSTVAGPGSALLLIDASETVDVPAIAKTVSPLLGKAASDPGHRVAVWNYSSPQTEGITNPVRANVLFDPQSNGVEESVNTLNSISSVGKPWLWRSLLPTYEYAVSNFAADMPNRVIMVTTGIDESGDDVKQALAEIQQMVTKDAPVSIEVVVLNADTNGGAQAGAISALQELATLTGGSVRTVNDYDAELSKALSEAMGV